MDGNGVGYYFTTLFYENLLFDFFFLNRPITYSGAQLWFLIALFVVSLVHYALVRLFQYTDMPIRYTRNAWFNGLPFFGLGYLLAQHDFHKKSWYKYLYLALAVGFTLLQIQEHNLVQAEVYASTVPAAAFTLLFFVGLKSPRADFFYKWFGKSMSFYVYILHMAVGIVIGRLWEFSDLFLRSIVIWVVSIGIYEVGYLGLMAYRHFKHKGE